ncbi:uncharacterized protein LOC128169108 [Crassostrea angulata]|uniref:uncharacterized protein LOC128169108 n=1 Tax=Magallana angulata TaxID=2784310 RepID=UPI0022B19BF9|nr:uncharacterized protein LOC128169108 [Crassostrea angulata]
MECSFSQYSRITCNTNFNTKPSSQICSFNSCRDNIDAHLSKNRINPSSLCNEQELVKFRAGLFEHETDQFTICPNHRYYLGKGWKASKLCMLKPPLQTCNGKRKIEKATVTVQQSRYILEQFGILIPVGAGVCRKCRSDMVHAILDKDNPTESLHAPVNTYSEDTTITTVSEERASLDKIPCDFQHNKDCEYEEEYAASCSTQMSNADSQGSLWLPNSQDTDTSEHMDNPDIPHHDNSMKRKALDNFLQSCGLSPVKKQLKINWNLSSERTQYDYSMKTKQIFEQVVNVLAPGQGSHLLDSVMNSNPSTSSDKTLEILSTAYDLSSDWGTQRQILSVFANNFTFKEMSTCIPNLTKYRYTATRKHASEKGQEQPVQILPYTREGLSEHQIKCFIDFVMSPSVMTDSPFLETKLKLSKGELYQVPQIILNSVRSRVVEQYQTFCRESGISDVASDRSYMRILQAIEPNIRKRYERSN